MPATTTPSASPPFLYLRCRNHGPTHSSPHDGTINYNGSCGDGIFITITTGIGIDVII
jgi:hypothetical protein